jgi:DNA polymerase-1
MHAQDILYEPEEIGLLVDQERLKTMINMYQEARSEIKGKLHTMAATLGFNDFNPGSHAQVRKLLFEKLGMTPIATTSGKAWSKVLQMPQAAQAELNPSTNKETLAILADQEGAHPIVAVLRDYRKVDYVCNHWLCDEQVAEKHDEASTRGGLLAKLWPDGRLHARFSQLKETARFGSAKPNVQNWMKRAEGELKRIIADDLGILDKYFPGAAKFPSMRTVIIPSPGHVFMEADWKQAEMFVLAALSGDNAMLEALTTPGRDLHDLTAVTAFGLVMYTPDGRVVTEDELVTMACADPDWEDDDSEFAKFRDSLIYVDQRGRKLTRKEFKGGIRVSAKNLNFGIPYGRGSQDIAIQVKAETGSKESIFTLQSELDVMMEKWKTTTYPDAWKYMEQCAASVVDPGYLLNPWGRPRYFPRTTDGEQIAKMGREAQNYPIQSTVADTCLIALWMMTKYREEHGLHFRIINQIHDAILVETPEAEIEATRQMFYETMGNIAIPIPGREPLQLGVDIDVMSRWAG